MRLRTFAAVLAAAPVLAVPGAAHADTVCTEVNYVSFSNGLSTLATSGTYSFTWIKQCPGGVTTSGGPITYGYSGDCVLAHLSNGVAIVGGLSHVEPTTSSKNGVYVPDGGNPCAFRTGILYGIKLN